MKLTGNDLQLDVILSYTDKLLRVSTNVGTGKKSWNENGSRYFEVHSKLHPQVPVEVVLASFSSTNTKGKDLDQVVAGQAMSAALGKALAAGYPGGDVVLLHEEAEVVGSGAKTELRIPTAVVAKTAEARLRKLEDSMNRVLAAFWEKPESFRGLR